MSGIVVLLSGWPSGAIAAPQDPDQRARSTEAQMTDPERFSLLTSLMPMGFDGRRDPRVPPGTLPSAGYVPGIPRLGIPALRMTDGSVGITNPSGFRPGDHATALPAALALGATFDPDLARKVGAMLGREARDHGFNVLLGGGMNLVRDPRNGRNFEYLSEDPLLTGRLTGTEIAGTQAEHVVSTVKHFSLNAQETNRHWFDARIDPAAHRESDLLAFQMALEIGHPGSVMAAYNQVNGVYASGSDLLLNGILKSAWGFKGWVMSDWGAVHDWSYAKSGLDQESGAQLDERIWFAGPLEQAFAAGRFTRDRLSDMVRRLLRSVYAVGMDRPIPTTPADPGHAVALEVARRGMVLLKNDRLLPLGTRWRHIAVIGGQAHLGVLTGAGSSQVTPAGGFAATIPLGGVGNMAAVRNAAYLPSSPLNELRKRMPGCTFDYDPGAYPADAAALARRSDLAIVFATRPESEEFDGPDLSLPFGQDSLIPAVARANPHTLVVLETGNPVAMPWHRQVRGILQAWFPGEAGGEAIAEILTGRVNPSGRLPITFPSSTSQLPRPRLPGFGTPFGTSVTVRYREGADVGYRWFSRTGQKPLYPFGYGLSYTSFAYRDLVVEGGRTLTARVTVTNTGPRAGADVPQLYLIRAAGRPCSRLLAFDRIKLAPGTSRRITLIADRRLLARFDGASASWRLASGRYRVAVGRNARDLAHQSEATVVAQSFKP